ncbi:MAG TPA: hypothetical protein PK514_12745 [Spirochaetota bacterium]|nr:hypothetical protein [Spirochaetota bacterium]
MKKLKNTIIDAPQYSVFVNDNRKILTDINRQFTDIITEVSERQKSLSSLVDELIRLAEISVTIHHQYTDRTGDEEIYKLKSVLTALKKHAKADKIHIQTAEYLANRVDTLINSAFESIDPELQKKKAETTPLTPHGSDLKHKWLTFTRNGSWFILPYETVNIIEPDPESLYARDSNHFIKTDDTEYEIADMMCSPAGEFRLPAYLVRIDEADFYYASDFNGREIYASSDIVSPLVKPLTGHAESIYLGRVRLFGVKYLFPDIKKLRA